MSTKISRGIEVLVLKAAVDPDFKQLLLQRRTAAAATIGLELTAAEAAMLAAVPAAQLEAIVARSSVPREHRRAFLGQVAAAMLAALGASTAAPAKGEVIAGIRAVLPPQEETTEDRVIQIISERVGVDAHGVKRDNRLVKDLGAKPADLKELRKDLENQFKIKVPDEALKNLGTVGEMVDYVERALKKKAVEERVIEIISKRTGVETKRIKRDTTLVKDLKAKAADLDALRADIEKGFDLKVPVDDFKKIGTVGDLMDYVEKALQEKAARVPPPISWGIRADAPPCPAPGDVRPD